MNIFWKLTHRLNDRIVAAIATPSSDGQPELQLLALEPRVLYSASPLPVEIINENVEHVEATFDSVEANLEFIAEAFDVYQNIDANEEATHFELERFELSLNDVEPLVDPTSSDDEKFQLVIIDTAVEGFETLLSDIIENRNSDSTVVRFVDSNSDGFAEVGKILRETSLANREYSAVHIVAHGDEASLRLGNATLNSQSLSQHSEHIISWREGLTDSADILLYGCNLAETEAGKSLIEAVSELSGADIAASDDVTGHESFQGDWDLEYVVGQVDADIVFSAKAQQSWLYSLQTTLGDESGTSHKSIGADFNGNQTIASSTDDSGSWIVQVSRYSNADPDLPLQQFDATPFENIQVNNDDGLGGNHQHAVVGSASNGDFVVAWTWDDGVGGTRVYAKLFASDGTIIRDQFQVDASGANGHNVTVAMNQSGEFVIGWEEDDVGDDDAMFSTFDSSGVAQRSRVTVDFALAEDQHDLTVSINDAGDVAFAYRADDPDTVYARVLDNGVLSTQFSFSRAGIASIRELSIDINNQEMIGVAFVATAGPIGNENQDIFALVLEYDSLTSTITNVSPTSTFGTDFSSISAQVLGVSGKDSGLEFSPSIAVFDSVPNGPETDTEFHVTWQGHGSWQNNLNDGTVTDGGANVGSSSSFPGGDVVADNGVFINSVTYTSDGTTTETGEYSLQNDLSDFDTNAKFASVVSYRNRTEYAFVFEDAAGDFGSQATLVNQTPDAIDSDVIGNENSGYSFAETDFGYSDSEGASLSSVRIESLPVVGTLSLYGTALTQTDIDSGTEISVANLAGLTYSPPADVRGQNVASFDFSVNDGSFWSQNTATLTIALSAEDHILVSTAGTPQGGSGIPGDGRNVLEFGGPDLAFGNTTAGDWQTQFEQSDIDINSLHFVNRNVTIGSGGTIVQRGDILFTTTLASATGPPTAAVVTTLPSEGPTPITITNGDIIRFRPNVSDYSSGTYEIIARVEQLYPTLPADYEINAITLVEQDAILGDVFLTAGNLLFSDSTNDNGISRLELNVTGETPAGTITQLIEGLEVGIDGEIDGLEFVEANTTAGGILLTQGTLLASTDLSDLVGSADELTTEAQDIFALNIERTTLVSGTASATATMFFDGSDVGAAPSDTGADIDAVSLAGNSDTAPTLVASPTTIQIEEDSVYRFANEDFVSGATSANLSYLIITDLPDPNSGQILLRGQAVVLDQVISESELEFLTFEPIVNESVFSDSFSYRAASNSEVLAESTISIEVTAVPNDVLTGSGSALEELFSNDFVVNTTTSDDQTQQQITSLSGGGYVIAWRSVVASNEQISLQLFDANHARVGGEISFNGLVSTNTQTLPEVVGLSDGGFLATASVSNGSDFDIWATRFDSTGQAVDLETGLIPGSAAASSQLIAGGSGNQRASSVAALQDGGFVIAWSDLANDSTRAKVVHGDFSNDIDLSESTAGFQHLDVNVSSLNQGGFVASWTNSTFTGETIVAKFYDVNGEPTSSLISVSTSNVVNSASSLDVLKDGNVIVVWSEESGSNPQGDYQVVGVVIDSDGAIVATEQTIAFSDYNTLTPKVVAMPDAGFLVTYGDTEIDTTGQSVAALRFDAQLNPLGIVETISADISNSQYKPDIAVLEGSNEVVAVWTSNASGDADIVANVYRNSATALFGERISLDLTASTLSGTSDSIVNITISGLQAGTRLFGTETATGNPGEISGPVFNLNDFNLDSIELQLPNGVDEVDYALNIDFQDTGAATSSTQQMVAKTEGQSSTLSGTIFNDDEADGLITGDGGFESVKVILYEDTGSASVEIDTAFTDASGRYEFLGLNDGTYHIVVDSKTIGSGLTSSVAHEDRIWAEQTWGSAGFVQSDLAVGSGAAGFLFGGRDPVQSDDATTLATSEHVNRQVISIGDLVVSNVDFAFSFNAVVNIEDQFDSVNPLNRTVQGSLRQFIENANLVDGANTMKFVPMVNANQSTDADANPATLEEWWRIDIVAELPKIHSSFTVVDGQAWSPTLTGLVELDRNQFDVANTYGGDVGTLGPMLTRIDAPELELLGNSTIETGIGIAANSTHQTVSNVAIRNLSVQGFGNDNSFGAAIGVHGDSAIDPLVSLSNVTISGNVIGASPNDAVAGVIARSVSDQFRGISISGAIDGVIENNVIVENSAGGIVFTNDKGNVTNWTIISNEIANNGSFDSESDGITGLDVSDLAILRNAIHHNDGMGIDQTVTNSSNIGWTIEENEIFENGSGTDLEGSGIRLSGDNTIVRYNSIHQNQYDGVIVSGYFDSASSTFIAGTSNLISQNSFDINGQRSIDVMVDAFGGETFANLDADLSGGISFGEANSSLQAYFTTIAALIIDDNLVSAAEAAIYYSEVVSVADGTNLINSIVNANVANAGIDAPEVASAEFDSGVLTIVFSSLDPTAESIELYATSATNSDPAGEGVRYFATVLFSSLNDLGGGSYSIDLPASDFPADIARTTPITAMAIDSANNSSELAANTTPVIVSNSAPQANPSSVRFNEDRFPSFAFSLSDFRYSDADLDPISEVVFTIPLSMVGQLELSGSAVADGDRIQASDIADGNLTFISNVDFNGSTTFSFAINDSTSDSGTATMTVNIDSVNDAPVGVSSTDTIFEDEVVSFNSSAFGFSDPVEGDAFSGVRIVSLTGSGSLELSGANVVDGDIISAADLANLRFIPGLNDFGTSASQITFRVIDDGGTDRGGVNEDSTNRTLTYDITAVNDAPTGADNTSTILEDETVNFTASSFGFNDSDESNGFSGVRIESFTGSGQLLLNGSTFVPGTIVSAAQLSNLDFIPQLNENGANIGSITFRVRDDGGTANGGVNEDQTLRTLTWNATPVNDAPTGTNQTTTILEDEGITFSASSFGFTDAIDGDSFSAVRIESFTGNGQLLLNGSAFASGNIVTLAELANLEFIPAANQNGTAIDSISFRVIDDGGTANGGLNEDQTLRTLTWNATAVNDSPSGQNQTITIEEDEVFTFATSTFGFSDLIDGDSFAGVRIESFSGNGQLLLNGSTFTLGSFVSFAQIENLEFVPATDENGIGIGTLTFRVQDDGGVANGGVNEDATSKTLTWNANEVNDAPNGQSRTLVVNEDELVPLPASLFGFQDSRDSDTLSGVRIVSFGGGNVLLNGSPVSGGTVIDAADFANLEFELSSNQHGSSFASLDFRVIDDGTVGGSNENEDLATRTISFNVQSVNDAPSGQDSTWVVDEETNNFVDITRFALTDVSDTPSNSLNAVRIVGLLGQGQLTLDGAAVANNSIINASDISRLTYESGTVVGVETATLRFRLIDDGGLARDGDNEDNMTRSINITVNPVNKAPEIGSTQFSNSENTTTAHRISAEDSDLDSFTFSIVSGADSSLFELTPDGSSIRFVSPPDYEAPSSIRGSNRYEVLLVATDSVGNATTPHSIFVDVTNVVEAIRLVDDFIVAVDGVFEGISVFENDNGGTAMPGDISVIVSQQPANGTATINSDGTFSYTSHSGQQPAIAQFSYTVLRGGESSTAIVSLVSQAIDPNNGNTDPDLPGDDPSAGDRDPDGDTFGGETDPTNSNDPSNPDSTTDTNPTGDTNPTSSNQTNLLDGVITPGNLILRSLAVSGFGADTVSNDFDDIESLFDRDINISQTIYSTYAFASSVDTGLLTGDAISYRTLSSRQAIEELSDDALSLVFWQELETNNNEYLQVESRTFETAFAAGAFGISGVIITFITRAALLSVSLGATYSQPWWMTPFDFLPIIESEDNESIAQIVEHKS